MSIASELTRLNGIKDTLQQDKTAIATAITNKGGTVNEGDGFDDFATDIGTIPSGTVSKPEVWEGVNFIDFDGTIVETWTPNEVASKTELPEINQSHQYLINDGWNWNLTDIKNFFIAFPNGRLYVGRQYKVENNAIVLFIQLDEYHLNPHISFCVNGIATIDWGDGNITSVSGSSTSVAIDTPHSYSSAGSYVIIIKASNTIYLTGNSISGLIVPKILWNGLDGYGSKSYMLSIKKVYLGNVYLPATYGFYGVSNLKKIVLSSDITVINNNPFTSAYSLLSVIIPSSVINCGIVTGYNLTSSNKKFLGYVRSASQTKLYMYNNIYPVYYGGVPTGISDIYFVDILPNSSIPNNFLFGMDALERITIPQQIITINAQAFKNCKALQEIHFRPTTPPAVANSNAFSEVPTTCKIYVPTGTLSAYTSATNYPNPNTYEYIEE